MQNAPPLEDPPVSTEASHVVLIDLRGARPGDNRAGPMAGVCGLPALVRTLLVLGRNGYTGAVLLTDSGADDTWRDALSSHPRLTGVPLETITGLADLPDAVARVAPTDQALYWPGDLTFGRLAPEIVTANAPDGGALMGPLDGPVLLSLKVLCDRPGLDLPDLLEALRGAGTLEEASLDLQAIHLSTEADTRRAEQALLFSLRKPVDGAVAKYDRYISLFISKRLMPLPVSPHLVTIGAALLGLACGLVASHGGYWWLLAGAIGFQLNSIMDGIDGEIARAKLLESRLGQWLDTIADDSCNLFFTVGAAVGCYRTWGSELYLWLAAIIGVGFILTAIFEYHYLITVVHSGDLNDFKMPWEEGDDDKPEADEETSGPVARALARLKFLVRRDTFVFLSTVFALIGQLRVMVWFFALGASIVWVAILVYRVILPRLGKKEEARP